MKSARKKTSPSRKTRSSDARKRPCPVGWTYARIGQLCDLVNGRAFKPSEWSENGLPIIRIQNLNNPNAEFNYFDGAIEERFIVNSGDLLFAWSGTPGTSFGAHIWTGGRAVLNQHIFKVVFNASLIDRKFFRWAINHKLEEFISKAHGGVGLRHITKGEFEATEIGLPPIKEQARIVSAIDRVFVRSHSATRELEPLDELIDRFRNLTTEMIFSDSDTQAEFESLIDEGPTNGWSPKSSANARGALSLKLTATTSGYLRLDDQAVKRIHEVPEPTSRLWLEPGDLLIQRANAIEHVGATAIFDGPKKRYIYPDLMMRVRVRDRSLREYLWRYLNSTAGRRYFRENATGSAGNMPKINATTLRAMKIPIPRDRDFQRVVDELADAYALVDSFSRELSGAKSLVLELEREVILRAVTGNLVTPDPTDEPAELLLERIESDLAARRASAKKTKYAKKARGIEEDTEMKVARTEVPSDYLQQIIRKAGRSIGARDLWRQSEMGIDDFYKQLRKEVKSGLIKEGAKKATLLISNAA